jgi:hypothetical protein
MPSEFMKRFAGIAMLLTVSCIACGATAPEGDVTCPIEHQGECAQPRGIYRTTYRERPDGTCGPRADFEGTVSSTRITSFPAPCSGTVHWASDFCSASFEASCPEEETGPGFTNDQVSETHYSQDGLMRTGTFKFTIFDADGNTFCESTYDTLTINLSCI